MKRFSLAGLLVLLAVWVAYAALGHTAAARIAHKWGAQMIRAGDGKFTDPAVFLQQRFLECAWLATLTVGLAVAVLWLGALVARRLPRLWQWIPYSIAGFAGLNVWIKFATGTCIFWCLFWNGKGTTDNLTQFHIKLLLMDENPAPMKVVLGGSSQVHAEIDPRLLNQQLGSNICSTELHFPGNRGYDFLWLDRALSGHKADVIVCYLSELNFYQSGFAPGFALFFHWGDIPEFLRLGGKPQWLPRAFGYALLGDILPVFWLRDPMAQRLIGNGIVELRKRSSSAPVNVAEEIRLMVEAYHATPASDFILRHCHRSEVVSRVIHPRS